MDPTRTKQNAKLNDRYLTSSKMTENYLHNQEKSKHNGVIAQVNYNDRAFLTDLLLAYVIGNASSDQLQSSLLTH